MKSSISMQAALSLNWNGLCSYPDPDQRVFLSDWQNIFFTLVSNAAKFLVDAVTIASKSKPKADLHLRSSCENLSRITCHFHRLMMAVWHGFYCLLDISSLTFDTTNHDDDGLERECLLMVISSLVFFSLSYDSDIPKREATRSSVHESFNLWRNIFSSLR